jgi:hypothetical protein
MVQICASLLQSATRHVVLEFALPSPSHANVTCALADCRIGAVSPEFEDEVVVSSMAAPSVRARKKLFDKSVDRDSGQLIESKSDYWLTIAPPEVLADL